MKKSLLALAAVAAAVVASAPAEARVRAGLLTCQVAPGVGVIFGSQKDVMCQYRSVRGFTERYVGRITRVGLDIGFTTGGTLTWAVYAPSRRVRGALAGDYVGATAAATVGVGLGANALVGGSNRSITLQPLSVDTQQGLDLALGVGSLQLDYVPRRR